MTDILYNTRYLEPQKKKHFISLRYVRTRQLGQNTRRRPEIIDNKKIYNSVVGGKIGELLTQGPDKRPKPYTP